MGILFSGKEIGGRDAGHRNRRVDAARKQKPHRRCAVAWRRLLAVPFTLDGGVDARLRVPETARSLLQAIPTLALYEFTT